MPTMPSYDGKADPRQHLIIYGWHMDTATTSDAMKLRCFPIFLEGVRAMWFTRLPPRSISSFDILARKFIEQFCMYTTHLKDIMSLSNFFHERESH